MPVVDQRPGPDPWKLLMEACARSQGIFTVSEAAALGCDLRRLSRLAANGSLVRESRGVYRFAAYPFGFDQRLLIATRTGGVVSHETAAVLWGFDGFDESTIHVTVTHGFLPTAPGWVSVHETRRSLVGLTSTRRSVSVTKPLRTALDLVGRPIGDEQYQGFLNHCVATRLLTPRALERFASESGAYVRGVRRLRAALADLCQVESVAESQLVEVLAAAGIDRPVTQFELRDGNRFVARIDLAWPTQCVALELDGYRYHADARSFVSDRERGNRIVSMGWALLRTTPTAVRQRPHMVVSDVKAALRRSAAA
jgi:very-short-patch-repair endonuclease/predicted transcriptional regulator of viral defense system